MNVPSPPWIEITTAFPCTVGCYYCPQDVLRKAYDGDTLLSMDNFLRILENVPKSILLDFAGFAEPFLNPQAVDMMLFAHEEGYRIAVNSTLTGLSDEDAKRLEVIPFDFFYYHDVRLEGRQYPFIQHSGRVDEPRSRAGNLYPMPCVEGGGICSRSPDHRINVMLPNGDVVLCCNDYGLKHKLGNLLTTNYEDLNRTEHYELCHTCEDWIKQ
jgi:hypothetical protein